MQVSWTGERVRLRPFADFAEYEPVYAATFSESTEFWGHQRCPLDRERRRFEETGAVDDFRGQLAVERMDDGLVLGSMSYVLYRNGLAANIGTFILTPHRAQGFGVEGKRLLIGYLYQTRPLERIEAITLTHHRAARRSVELAGMRREYIRRRCTFSQGRWASWVTYVLFREEWEQWPEDHRSKL